MSAVDIDVGKARGGVAGAFLDCCTLRICTSTIESPGQLDRRVGVDDGDRGEAGRDVRRRGRLQRSAAGVARGGGDAAAAPERFTDLGIDPPKGVLLYGPPGTGKTLSARAVANRTEATFIRVLGSELVQKYVGEGARMVRELFQLARSKKACIIFFDEVDSIGGTRFDGDGDSGDTDVQNTMLELVNQLDGFDARGNIKVLMATNRPDTLDPALKRPGRLDRKVEFGLPDLEGRTQIFKIHARPMTCERGIRFELLARLCPNTTGAEIRSVCTEAGMFAIRARRKAVTEEDFLNAIDKVIKGYQKFSSTSKYMVYNSCVCWR